MLLTNLIISSILSLNSITLFSNNNYEIKNPVNTNTSYNFLKDENNFFKISSKALLANSVSLIYTDIFTCTKPNYGGFYIKESLQLNYSVWTHPYTQESFTNTVYSVMTTTNYICEKNLIADLFFSRGLWITGYLIANIFNYTAIKFLDYVDNTGITSYCYSIILNIIEISCIYTWKDFPYTREFKIEFPILTLTF